MSIDSPQDDLDPNRLSLDEQCGQGYFDATVDFRDKVACLRMILCSEGTPSHVDLTLGGHSYSVDVTVSAAATETPNNVSVDIFLCRPPGGDATFPINAHIVITHQGTLRVLSDGLTVFSSQQPLQPYAFPGHEEIPHNLRIRIWLDTFIEGLLGTLYV